MKNVRASRRSLEWEQLYEAAFLEANPMELPRRIAAAQAAMAERVAALLLKTDCEVHPEWQSLALAMRVREELKKIKLGDSGRPELPA